MVAGNRQRRFPAWSLRLVFLVLGLWPAPRVVGAQDRCTGVTLPLAALREPVTRALEIHPLVGVGELHGLLEQHCALRQLIRELVAARRIDAVVIEFGNARFQAVVDEYLRGADLPDSTLRKAWRNTTQVFAWHEAMYGEFYRFMREVARAGPVRLILADPAVDWDRITRSGQVAEFPDRSAFSAQTVEREVLSPNRRAILIFGAGHLRRTDGDARTLADHLDRRASGRLFVVQPSLDDSDARMVRHLDGANMVWHLGPIDSLHADVPEASVSRDDRWLRELQRRANLASAAGHGPPTPPDMRQWLTGRWPTSYRERFRFEERSR